jgi:hypothetical protein
MTIARLHAPPRKVQYARAIEWASQSVANDPWPTSQVPSRSHASGIPTTAGRKAKTQRLSRYPIAAAAAQTARNGAIQSTLSISEAAEAG